MRCGAAAAVVERLNLPDKTRSTATTATCVRSVAFFLSFPLGRAYTRNDLIAQLRMQDARIRTVLSSRINNIIFLFVCVYECVCARVCVYVYVCLCACVCVLQECHVEGSPLNRSIYVYVYIYILYYIRVRGRSFFNDFRHDPQQSIYATLTAHIIVQDVYAYLETGPARKNKSPPARGLQSISRSIKNGYARARCMPQVPGGTGRRSRIYIYIGIISIQLSFLSCVRRAQQSNNTRPLQLVQGEIFHEKGESVALLSLCRDLDNFPTIFIFLADGYSADFDRAQISRITYIYRLYYYVQLYPRYRPR